MQEKFTRLTPALYDYVLEHNPPPDPVLRELADETAALGGIARMQVAVEQAAFLALLVRATGSRRAVEIGTFTGYSAIAVARALPPDGHLLCCDVSEEWSAIARRYFARAGVADRITLRIAPALETLGALPDAPELDFAFIDADKEEYRAYYDALLPRLRPNGLVVFDNVLWGGRVIDATDSSPSTQAIRALNQALVRDTRIDAVMLPIADGVTLVRKR